MSSTVVLSNGAAIDGNGNTITFDNKNETDNKNNTHLVNVKDGATIENVTILESERGIGYHGDITADVIVKNVVIDDCVYTIHVGGSSNDSSLIVSDSTLYGWTSYGDGLKVAKFTNCTFGQGASSYSYIRPYSNTEFDGCTFEDGFKMGAGTTGFTITLTDCYYNGVLVTADNFQSLLIEAGDSDIANLKLCIIIVNGVTVTLT